MCGFIGAKKRLTFVKTSAAGYGVPTCGPHWAMGRSVCAGKINWSDAIPHFHVGIVPFQWNYSLQLPCHIGKISAKGAGGQGLAMTPVGKLARLSHNVAVTTGNHATLTRYSCGPIRTKSAGCRIWRERLTFENKVQETIWPTR